MKKFWEEIITNTLNIEPIRINSENYSAQRHDRLYWTNAFEINPVEESEYGADGNPFTVLVTEGEAQFAVTKEQSKGRCVALLGTPTDDAKYRVLNKRGKVIREVAIETPYVEIANLKGAASIEFEGVNNVFEVMFLPLL